MIYLNGDSHTAGAEIIKNYCFAEDDKQFVNLGRRPHPEALPFTFGHLIANELSTSFYTDAESGSSNSRILRTTKKYLENNEPDIVIIGWSTFEREEWQYDNKWLQLSASGTDNVPDNLKDKYKSWVLEQTPTKLNEKEKYWHTKIYEFHNELNEKNIKHIFFNSFKCFRNTAKHNWRKSFIGPYDDNLSYYNWCLQNGYKTKNNGYHFGKDAHKGWAKILVNQINQLTKLKKFSILNFEHIANYTGF
tara:strand:+ start:365 stop:1108 length:744 start_codon:yes stop_codon:yes gene_type:complete